jgi:hypothetical protein
MAVNAASRVKVFRVLRIGFRPMDSDDGDMGRRARQWKTMVTPAWARL